MRDDLPNPSSPWFWDFLIGLTLLSTVLPALGLTWALPQIDRARVSEAFSVFRAEQIEMQERFALSAPWPDTSLNTAETLNSLRAELRSGAIDARFGADFVASDTVLTLRAGVPQPSTRTPRSAHSPPSPATTLLWQCGHAEFPTGVVALAADQTTLPDYLLPLSCRRQHAVTH